PLIYISPPRLHDALPISRDTGFRDALCGLRTHLTDLIHVEPFGAALVHTSLLGGGNPLGLTLTDHGTLELSEGSHEIHLELGEGICVDAREKGELLSGELERRALARDAAGELIEVHDRSRESIH